MTLLQDIQLYAQKVELINWERKAKETTLTNLLSLVCSEFDTTRSNIQSKSRKRWLCAYPRFVFCWIAYCKLNFKLKEIALFLGYKEHCMAIYGRDTWQRLLDVHKKHPKLYSKEKQHHNNLINAVYEGL